MTSDDSSFKAIDVPLRPALEIGFSFAAGGKATHYAEYDGKLVLAWHESAGTSQKEHTFNRFLVPLTHETAYDVILQWLKDNPCTNSKDPYADGDKKTFHIYTGPWGLIDHNQYTFLAIEPIWVGLSK